MASDPPRDWSSGLLLIGGTVLAFSLAFSAAQILVANVSERNVGFITTTPAAIGIGLILVLAGVALRLASDSGRRPRDRD